MSRRTLGHFTLLEKLGAGSMGEVWVARDERLGRRVAVKLLPEKLARDPERLARVDREARALAALNHPGIVTLYSVEEAQGVRFLAMELVEGETLKRRIPAGGLPLPAFLEIATALADAVGAAHERGVTHRDLKPANVMLTRAGRVKVLDFGLAKLRPEPLPSEDPRTATATLMGDRRLAGTLPYMSPEQLAGREIDHRSDIFSLGAVLYEMATGERPFRGDSAPALIASILRDRPPAPSELRPELPRQLDRVLRHCLRKRAGERTQSAVDLRNELEDLRAADASDGEPAASIAVLPFADMSPERDQDYLCEGIAEELINALTAIEGLRVASRTSAFRFGPEGADVREIGRRLHVATVLEGSVRKFDDRLRIGVQLISVADGYHVWSRRYDREMSDVFAIQDEIAESVARALEKSFGTAGAPPRRRQPTTVVRAYDYYLRGRQFLYRDDKRNLAFARQMFQRAIEADPDYALAFAGLADAYSYLHAQAGGRRADLQRALEASRRALELAPDLGEAWSARGHALSIAGRHDEAERAFRAALERNPRLFEARYFYARAACARGELEKAARHFELACELRPDDFQATLLLRQVYVSLGREADAMATAKRGLAVVERHLRLNPDDARASYLRASALIALGEREKGIACAERALELGPEDPVTLYGAACSFATAGEPERALACLERAVAAGFSHLEWIRHDSDFDRLREHPRFQALVSKETAPA